MIPRLLSSKVRYLAKKFPVIAITGPRQSGKTTLAKLCFPNKPYVTLEDLDIRELAREDPRGFLARFPKGAVLDEIQRTPSLFSYLQSIVDEKNANGLFILTGSQNLLLLENLSQTLAGRVSISTLLPFSLEELEKTSYLPRSPEHAIFMGMYPRIYDKKLKPTDWYPVYIRNYIERDVRLIKNIGNLNTFQKFLKMCAARTGSILNLSSLAIDCGVTHNTIKAWISILEASYIIHLLYPHHNNFNKRLVKNPKLYFHDAGLACSLLGIETQKQLETHSLRGNLFETLIVSELIKYRLNRGLDPRLFFWRDKTGHEIDCIFEKASNLVPIEIKSSKTMSADFWKNLIYWKKAARRKKSGAFLICAGDQTFRAKEATVLGWKSAHQCFA